MVPFKYIGIQSTTQKALNRQAETSHVRGLPSFGAGVFLLCVYVSLNTVPVSSLAFQPASLMQSDFEKEETQLQTSILEKLVSLKRNPTS